MPALLNKQPLDPTYYSDLTGPERLRYTEKVEMCDRIDPFTLRPDTANYLVFSANYLTLEEMKAFKSTEAHNYFTSGWVKGLSAKQLQDDKVLLLGEVNHSQRLQPLRVWILSEKDGVVLSSAHCTCMAGEACSHVGACLYAVETGVRMRNGRRKKLVLVDFGQQVRLEQPITAQITIATRRTFRQDANCN
ncbi:hypothetical protein HPB50_026441 [Hyalomma asiaticum]|uniref:Uncharacterized protein n=1 Tax=Hyalomma asiaticum TaxID=266040 RepID=A0ACB7T058_HYAAI|nr:hypothetical protein HPB50_026441 [Hyalomma asiaticum]